MIREPEICLPRGASKPGFPGPWPMTTLEPDNDGPISVVLASEVRFLRESLIEILRRAPGIGVLGCAANAEEAVGLSQELRPDMVLIDAGMREGQATVRRLRETMAGTPVVAFSVTESVGSILNWAEAGVAGYIPNTAAVTDIGALIIEIRAGRQNCSPDVAAGLLRRIAMVPSSAAEPLLRPEVLTFRELQVVRLISAGLSNKEIARQLEIGLATTKSHVHNALAKLNMQRRGQIAAWLRAETPRPRSYAEAITRPGTDRRATPTADRTRPVGGRLDPRRLREGRTVAMAD
jgi:two-component system, NarL family, nitrate/nitrite response regulator NarL